MMLDSHIERRVQTPLSLGIPRWHKRVNYYIFKIRYLQLNNKKISVIPNFTIRNLIINNYYNEYEVYN
jgi:hypothetical protein